MRLVGGQPGRCVLVEASSTGVGEVCGDELLVARGTCTRVVGENEEAEGDREDEVWDECEDEVVETAILGGLSLVSRRCMRCRIPN